MENSISICKFCGSIRKNANSLRHHERLCKLNSNRDNKSISILQRNTQSYRLKLKTGQASSWNKGKTKATDSRILKSALYVQRRYQSGELIPVFAGKHHTAETKNKQRLSTKAYISKTAGGPRYSIKACNYFDMLNKERGWHLQHARNGGEVRVGRYALDAYDAELNIVVEYDEHHHHIKNGIRSMRDIDRELKIKNTLSCRFYRYCEDTNELYEV